MYITMNRPLGASFDVFATDGQSELLPQKVVNSLKNLTWESVVVKNYCLAVNQQADLILEDIPELSTVQIDSRITANLWLNEISIAVNEVYTTVDYFCGAYRESYEKLKALAKDLENKANKENFIDLIDGLKQDIKEITSAIGRLRKRLREFGVLLARDSNRFASLVEKAKKILKGNVEKTRLLQQEIAALNEEMKSLNLMIAATAVATGVALVVDIWLVFALGVAMIGGIGGVIGGVVVISASLGLAGASAGLGLSVEKLLSKQRQYSVKNEALQALENVTATAIAIENQYIPLISTGNKAIVIVQGLSSGWQEITDNFDRLSAQVSEIKHSTDGSAKIQESLENTSHIISEIVHCIEQHKKYRYIQTRIDLPAASALLPNAARRLGLSKRITLPTHLYAAYVRRMQMQARYLRH